MIFADTDIKIQTLKDHRISVIIRQAEKLTTIESFHKDTENGNLTITITTSRNLLDIIVTLNKDGNKIINRKFEGIANEDPIYILFKPGDIDIKSGEDAKLALNPPVEEPESNESTNDTVEQSAEELNKNNTAEETTDNNIPEKNTETEENSPGKITGFSVKGMITSKKTLYSFATIVIIILILFGVIHVRKKLNSDNFGQTYLDSKPSLFQDSQNNSRLAIAERKLKEAQGELEIIKNKEQSQEKEKLIEERIRRDREELKKLKSDF